MLSIIIPTRNEERYIDNCLSSILSQDYRPIEVIVSDGASTDRTQEIVLSKISDFNKKGLHLKLIRGEKKNPANGRNVGVMFATGDKLLFLDADVTFPNWGFLSRYMEWVNQWNVKIATCGEVSSGLVGGWMATTLNPIFAITGIVSGNFVYVKRWIFDRVNGFDERYDVPEGVEFGLRVWLATGEFPIRYFNELIHIDCERRMANRGVESVESAFYGLLGVAFNRPELQKLSRYSYW